jgi:hypothetical protein
MKGKIFFLLTQLAILSSCAGYHFNTNNNPLIGYDIKTISVPMFINRSVLPDLAAPMTKEIILVLNDYPGLKVINNNVEEADAVLVGIIDSAGHYNDTVRSTQYLFSENTIKDSTGSRSSFYYPTQTTYDYTLKVYLIKKPTEDDLALLTGDLSFLGKASPKVVLSDTINLSNSFSRVVGQTDKVDSSGKTNFTKNKGIFEKSIRETAVSAAKNV